MNAAHEFTAPPCASKGPFEADRDSGGKWMVYDTREDDSRGATARGMTEATARLVADLLNKHVLSGSTER